MIAIDDFESKLDKAIQAKQSAAPNPEPATTAPAVKSDCDMPDNEKAEKLLQFLSQARCDEYGLWYEVGAALHASGCSLDVWDAWSRNSSHYEPGACAKKWEGQFEKRGDGVGLGSLITWAAQDQGTSNAEVLERVNPCKRQEGDVSTSSAWLELIELGEEPILDFPLTNMSPVLRDFVCAVAANTEVSPDLPGLTSICAVASAAAGRYCVSPRTGWVEPVNLFGLCVAESGGRKSGVHAICYRPMRQYEQRAIEAARAKVAASESAKRILVARQKSMEAQVSKGKGAQAEMDRVNRELAEFKDIHLPAMLTTDATPEKIAMLMEHNDGVLTLASAEGTAFAQMTGLYSGGQPHVDAYLQGHAGDPITVDRVGRDRVAVPNPALTVCLCVQPAVLTKLRHKEMLVDSGLFPRFLISTPTVRSGMTMKDVPEIPNHVYAAYERLILNLLCVKAARPLMLEFDAEGQDLFFEFRQNTGERIMSGDLVAIPSWGAKLPGQLARLAGLFHLCESHESFTNIISAGTVQQAVGMAEYFISHAKRGFSHLEIDEDLRVAKRISAWITRKGITSFGRKQVFDAVKTTCLRRASQMDKPLGILEDQGYVQQVPPSPEQVGRPAQKYIVNPRIHPAKDPKGKQKRY